MSVMPPTPAGNSSTTLWATASKEWVIPPKPKPGRKPKKDASQAAASAPSPVDAPSPSSSVDPAGRRVQNRAAQRAFRERKQSQLAELQERIKQYEQGEIERNVALQQISKRVKDENDALIAENRELKDRIIQLEQERDAALAAKAAAFKDAEIKRSQSRSPERFEAPARKRKRTAVKEPAPQHAVSNPVLTLSLYDPPSLVNSPSVSMSEQDTSPAPDPIPQQDLYVDTMNLDFDFSLSASSSRPPVYENAVPMDSFDCGFCSDNTPCVCREIAMQSHAPSSTVSTFKVEPVEPSLKTISLDPAPSDEETSILDNLPAFQPAVPLRRRSDKAPAKSLFPVVAAPSGDCGSGRASAGDACSGDPSNCPACADDAFGRAFCTAVGEAVASQGPCADCPSRTAGPSQSAADAGVRLCCGNPALCGGGACAPPANSTSVTFGNTEETMPTSEAWRQIKSHPNVEFADLRLLADVVARRAKCSGPTVVIEPALGSITPERSSTPATIVQSSDAILLSDPHALFKQRQERGLTTGSPPPRLVPHDELVACAQRRAPRQVQAAGVREALEMLDAQFGQT